MKQTGMHLFAASCVCALSTVAVLGQAPFTEESSPRGISYTIGAFVPAGGYGVAFSDLDGDGDPDVILLGADVTGTVGVYENDGNGYFTDRSAGSNIPANSDASGITSADYDGDGDLDLYFSNNRSANVLMRNDGGFRFTDVTAAAGVGDGGAGQGVAWGDYDGDGWIDMYLANRTDPINTEPNRLYHNLGNGTFQEVAGSLGVDRGDDPSFHASFLDYNRDGWTDLYVCNDKGSDCDPFSNHMFRNDGGTFTNVTVPTQTQSCVDCMGTAVGDLDGNGYHDMHCTNTPPGNSLMMNQDGSIYQEYASTAGVESFATGWGNIFFDYDNDGFLDLYVCNSDASNRLYEYNGSWPVTDVAGTMAVAPPGMVSYTVSAADVEGDGDLDLLVSGSNTHVRLFINHEGESRNWLEIRLVGEGANTSALGAIVEITVGPQTRFREVFCGIGFKSDWPSGVHFGLGSATTVDQITITWPGGSQGTLQNVAANQTLILYQADSDFDGWLDAGDCAPLDSTRWSVPGEVESIQLQHDAFTETTTVNWGALADPGASSMWYDVLRSVDPDLFASGATCIESDDGADTTAVDTVTPGSGSASYFLVRGENGCPNGSGSLGTDSEGSERSGRSCP